MSQQYSSDASPMARADAPEVSPGAGDDARVSPGAGDDACEASSPPGGVALPCGCVDPVIGPRARHCCKRARQTAYRARKGLSLAAAGDRPLRVAYADPPYPGKAKKYYKGESTYKGEVPHAELLASLKYSYDGWALSTSAEALPQILPLCPPGVRICSWVKPGGVPPKTRGPHNVWEVVIVSPARRERPGVPDALVCHPARGGGKLPGRKPLRFCLWLFRLLGLRAGDELHDLFPGTGIVGRVWAEVSRAALGDGASPAPGCDASSQDLDDTREASPRCTGDGAGASAAGTGDGQVSLLEARDGTSPPGLDDGGG